jgi:hypothetical protein
MKLDPPASTLRSQRHQFAGFGDRSDLWRGRNAAYSHVREAVSWLCAAFGFTERLRIGDHRAQLVVPGGSALIVTPAAPEQSTTSEAFDRHRVMVRVLDVDGHYQAGELLEKNGR